MHVGVGVNVRVWARPGWPGYMTDSWPEKVSQSGPERESKFCGEGDICLHPRDNDISDKRSHHIRVT